MSEDDETGAFADTAYMPSVPPPEQGQPTGPATPVRPSVQRALHSSRPPPEPGGHIGRFVLERKLGEGGMGMVFEARDPDLQRTVALKLLRPGEAGSQGHESQQRMLREAQAMAMLQHPNLVTIYEVGVHGKDVFLAMEYVVGQTMGAWLAAGQHLEDKLEVFEQAALALQAVHDAGLVHRDFKPDNVMVTRDGTAKVLDLGIARRIVPGGVEQMVEKVERKREERAARDEAVSGPGSLSALGTLPGMTTADAFHSQLTQAGSIVGTPSYMAPEQLLGEEVGPAADQFSFAIALYEAIVGSRPFPGASMVEMMANVVADERKPWPEDCEAPPKLRAAIDRALSNRPEDRFGSMSELFEACREGLGLRGQIRFLTARWLKHGRDEDYLLSEGELLREGRELLALRPQALSADQAELVSASQKAVRRRALQRKALTFGVAFLLVALLPALWLIERRSAQLQRATIAGVRAHIEAVSSRVEALFERDRQHITLMFAQRGVWAPVADTLFAEVEGAQTEPELAEPALAESVRRLNQFFAPVVVRTDTISSLMVARDDEGEYLVFDDPDAAGLSPPYRLYNRVVHRPRFGQNAFEFFHPARGRRPPRRAWLHLGEPDSRGQPWTGYTPTARPWFAGAVAEPDRGIAWTEPYLFFVTKDAGVTGSVAFERGGHRYVLGVDFMLTDLSRITALGEPEADLLSFVTSLEGELVALPADPRFASLEDVRAFFVGFDQARRHGAARAKTADAAAELPRVADLGVPLLSAAFEAGADAEQEVYPFAYLGETLWAGRAPVGDADRGLTLYVVEKP